MSRSLPPSEPVPNQPPAPDPWVRACEIIERRLHATTMVLCRLAPLIWAANDTKLALFALFGW